MISMPRSMAAALVLASPLALLATPCAGQIIPAPRASAITYADVASLADSAPLVVRARVRKLARVEDERTRGLRPGQGRFYVQAETRALITGSTPIGGSFAYLVDLPLDARGKPALRKKDEVILFARPVSGRPGELQLVQPNAQILGGDAVEAQVRSVVTALLSPDAPGKVTGVREMIHVSGALAGEGETQIFLNTADASAASITVRRAPGRPPEWGVSFSELVAQVGQPPRPETLEWFRLACSLPRTPPPGVNVSEGPDAQRAADEDYRLVIDALGPCSRTL